MNDTSDDEQWRSCRKIPAWASRYFHGRQEYLDRIHDHFVSAAGLKAIVDVAGLRGIGKTQLVAEYCKRFSKEYFACIWVPAHDVESVESALSSYTRKMKVRGISPYPDMNAEYLLDWLKTTDKRCLVIFDNVTSALTLRERWPQGNHHIITTRRNPYMSHKDVISLDLPLLGPTESKELLYKVCGENKENQKLAMEYILRECGGSPLALCHFGNIIRRHPNSNIAHFLDYYREFPAMVYELQDRADPYPDFISTAFSLYRLGEGEMIMKVLCYFDPDSIPIDLLRANFDHGQPLINVKSESDLSTMLWELRATGLICKTDDHIKFPRIEQTVALLGMSKETRITTFNQALSLLSRIFARQDKDKLTWPGWNQCEEYWTHVNYISRRSQELFDEGQKNAELASVLSACTWSMVEYGRFPEAEPLIKLAQEVCPAETDEAQLTTATVLFNLARMRFECNRVEESLELYEKVLEIHQRLLSREDPHLGNTFLSLGIVYMEAGRLQESLDCHLKAVGIHSACQKQGKHDGSFTAQAYLNLGLCHWKMGELEIASVYVMKGLSFFEKIDDKTSYKYGQGLSYLSLLREAENELDKAKEASRMALEIYEAITPRGFRTGLGLHRMSTFLHRDGELEQALDYLQRAILIFETCLEPIPMIARSTFKMSQILKDMGKGEEAAEKKAEAEQLQSTITTFPYDTNITPEAFDTLVPSFLR